MKKGFFERKNFPKKKNFLRIFPSPNIMKFGTQVGGGSRRMPYLHPKRVLEVGRYSRNSPTQRYVKNMAKTRFLTLANPTLKTFFRRVSRGPLVQM